MKQQLVFIYLFFILFFTQMLWTKIYETESTPGIISHVVTYLGHRSQSTNAARLLVGSANRTHLFVKNKSYVTVELTAEATKSFRPERIMQCLFGDAILKCKNTLTVSGSRTTNRVRNRDWSADQFGLATDFKSTTLFRPRVNNFIVDAQLFAGLDSFIHGLYIELHIPFVYTNWDLNITEFPNKPGINNHDPGYFNATGVNRNQLLNSFTEFISGAAAPQIDGLIFHKLAFSKMNSCSLRSIGIAEIQTALGYHILHTDWHHLGCSLRFSIPAGNRPQAEFLFEPVHGNGHHWEFGGGLSGHVCVFNNTHTDQKLDLYCKTHIMHLFSTTQRRSFDLKENPNSRYLLAQKISSPIENNLTGHTKTAPFTSPSGQFKQELTPLANITTFDVNVTIAVQADVVFMASYTHKKFDWSWGYGIFKRSCEKITIHKHCSFPENTWALKGDAHMFGFVGQAGTLANNTPVALSTTQHTTAITGGNNFPKQGTTDVAQIITARRNSFADNIAPAFAGSNQRLVASTDDVTAQNQIHTSMQPRYISVCDINYNSAETYAFSQKIFTHVNRLWSDHAYKPFVGFGAEVEFGRRPGQTPIIPREKCINCALSYWGIWLKGGASF